MSDENRNDDRNGKKGGEFKVPPRTYILWIAILGAIPLLVRAGYLDASRFDEAWRLWPLILVAVGLSILLGRGRTGLAGTVILALVVGIVGGGALAGGFSVFGNVTDCAGTSTPLSSMSEAGVFEGKASVAVGITADLQSAGPVSAS